MARGGPSILIVDPDRASRVEVAKLFRIAGLEPIEAASGEEALAVARETFPDLVLVEVALPDVGGYEVCWQLRREFGERFPIMLTSAARKDATDRAAGFLIGADDYMLKPFDHQELLARVRRLLERSERAGRPSADDRIDLTAREAEVLELLADGVRPAEIAAELVISRKTVSNHVQHILRKLDVHTQAQAVARAFELGIVQR